ncbi:Serine/threonine-protein kinase StkP [Caulifigura coniformis]|uniref:Serine/threonine-protein kinase StkP n=1 Tax=Caulifigura coniformis TaxID=2527983 RepID=A0A517SI64_9PLAN|nr:serine/threonine-protein kinase [Caulifigura coniformis]QDT55802.1 Serine/threonine-protein kinase StkP [Caulifigura coniformis]
MIRSRPWPSAASTAASWSSTPEFDADLMTTGELNADDLEGLVGRELDGRYLLDQFIDRGGFGVVYRGIDKKFNSSVAVKVGLSYREFMKEAKLAAEVRHDNIVQVSDYGNDHGLAYLVMEFLQGDDLEKLFKEQGHRLTNEQLRKLVAEVGDALSHAHSDQLIHRDLKPRNIILKTSRNRTGSSSHPARFVLLDFGIAAKLDAKGTQRNRTQDGAGTVEYMAPELLRTSPVATVASDIYAFGVILYQMMTGRVPFQQCDNSHMALAECLNAIAHQLPAPFSEVAPDRKYPAAAEAVVMQCLEKEAAKRPATMSEVRDQFLRAMEPAPAAASSRPRDLSQTLRPGELDDTAPTPDQRLDSWNPERQRSSGGTRWPWIVAALALLAVAVFGLTRPGQPSLTFETTSTLSSVKGAEIAPLDGQPLELVAGERLTVAFEVLDVPRDATLKFDVPEAPAGVVVKEEAATGSSRTYSIVIDDPNQGPAPPLAVVFKATASHLSNPFEQRLELNPLRPKAWLPDSLRSLGYREASDSRLCRIGNEVFSTVLERRVGAETVRMLLVPETEINDRRIRTFYVMERLVSKAQFQAFAAATPDYQLASRSTDERKWESGPEGPVTDIYVLEAQRFARWLAGPSGSLPATSEWELAAGYYAFQQLLEARGELTPDAIQQITRMRRTDPLLGAESWVGKGPSLGEFNPAQGSSCKGCSPYGLKFDRLASGTLPAEMTSTLVSFTSAEADLKALNRNDVPRATDKALRDGLYSARLRGFPMMGESPEELWVKNVSGGQALRSQEDLDGIGTLVLLPEHGIGFDSYIGFRVVISTEGAGSATASREFSAGRNFVRN